MLAEGPRAFDRGVIVEVVLLEFSRVENRLEFEATGKGPATGRE